jgi:hypothetical protein
VVQEVTKEVGPVGPMDLRVERVDILHSFVPIHHLGRFLDRYIRCSRGTAKTRAGSAIGPIWEVQERLFSTGTSILCRQEFARLLLDQVSKQTLGGTEGQCANSKHGLH